MDHALSSSTMKASTLPTFERFQPQTISEKPLTKVQRLVLENKKKIEGPLRRRNTTDVHSHLLHSPIEIGAKIWIPDPEIVWQMAEVIDYDGEMTIRVIGIRGTSSIDLREISDLFKVNPRPVDDMTSLYYIHEAAILSNLCLRSQATSHQPYTFMANVLIAVNPLIRLVEPRIDDYVRTQMGERPPHPYAIAEVSFQQMTLRSPPKSQSIIISGESGAGKTETSKIVLRYLTSRGHISGNDALEDSSTKLDKRLLDTNPILEAFGNAKTLRNHNSSRFGKFMKLQFSVESNYTLFGAAIETYLLEKSRLVFQIPGERNFHIFYFLIAGASQDLKSELFLNDVNDFHYLNQSGCVSDPNVEDEILFDEVCRALDSVSICESVQKSMFCVLAGLLHLGNIDLIDEETSEGDASSVVDRNSLALSSKLLGVDPLSLENVICKRAISTRGEVFTIKRNAREGGYVRDAISKSIYHHLFGWIVYKINISLGHGSSTLPFIGVLDIFGFEAFDYNDFEQLLINYANEALQATFNQQVFIAEQELFKSEGIVEGTILWPDNRDCIELISKKNTGILPLLDAEAKTQKPSDEKWNFTLHDTHKDHPHFMKPHEKDKKYVFIIKHFATKVEYTVGNFIDKNNDTIPKDLEDFVMSSNLSLIREAYSISTEGDNSNKNESVSSKFCRQMKSLMNTLDETRCNFIRCIKPNPSMTYRVFDNGYVVDQLRCTGMLATCELLKVGLPTRVSYSEICAIYKPILPETVTPMFQQYNDRTFTEAVLWAFRVDADAYRLGRTKVFFKTGKIALLDALLKVDMKKMGPWIVSRLKKWLARRRWRYATAKVIGQSGFMWLYGLIKKKKESVLKIQSIARMSKVRRKFLVARNNAREKQRKKALARKRWLKAFSAIVAKNKFINLYRLIHIKHIKILTKRKESAVKIQSIIRVILAKKKADGIRTKEQEAAIRKMLSLEQEAKAIAVSKRARRYWKSALIAVTAQRIFLDRFRRIRQAKLAAEEAKIRAEIEAEKKNQVLSKLQNESATKIQALFRGYLDRESTIQLAARKTANQAALAAAAAVQEAAVASEEARLAQKAEEFALQKAALAAAAQEAATSSEEARLAQEAGKFALQKATLAATAAAQEAAVASEKARLARQAEEFALQTAEIQLAEAQVHEISQLPARLLSRDGNLMTADLSWMSSDAAAEGEMGSNVEAVASSEKVEELAQAGRDLFGEGGEHYNGPLLEAEDENLINPVERMQEFPTGPPIPYKGGIFTCTMFGHRKQQDENWGDEYTEYVLRCTWGRDVLDQSKTAWLVGGRYNDFNALHQELKAAASGRRGKRPAWFPRFPKRYPFSSLIGKNQEERFIQKREKELNRYMTQVLTQMPDALLNIHMDRFMNLSLRTQDISEREAYAEAKMRWEEEEKEALVNAADAEPLNESELHEVEQLVHQLLEKMIYCQGDVRHDSQLQEMIHAVKVLQPRVAASSQIGAGVNMELVPLAMQLQDDILDVFNQYSDTLLALRLERDLK